MTGVPYLDGFIAAFLGVLLVWVPVEIAFVLARRIVTNDGPADRE